MAFRGTYELAKPLAIHLLQNITTLSKHKAAKPGKFIWKLSKNQHPDYIQAIITQLKHNNKQ